MPGVSQNLTRNGLYLTLVEMGAEIEFLDPREEGGEPFVIATLGVGETVGEVALVLRRKANADVVAVHPTVTLHLPREDFLDLIRDHPAILAGLYLAAVERDEETSSVLSSAAAAPAEDYILV